MSYSHSGGGLVPGHDRGRRVLVYDRGGKGKPSDRQDDERGQACSGVEVGDRQYYVMPQMETDTTIYNVCA